MKNKLIIHLMGIFAILASIFFITGCNNTNTDSSSTNQEVNAIDEDVIVEEDAWLIAEHQINTIPLTSKATSLKKEKAINKQETKKAENKEDAEDLAREEEYEVVTMEEMEASLVEQNYIARHTVEVTEIAIPLEETQTVVAYNKKGKEESEIQVISNGEGEVEQIIFTHKKHKDVYDVQTGLTGKQIKHLRKEMKHMVKKGKVFLYNDESNIMYLMDAKDMVGDEITAADVETMEVQAIIWKNNKHHKNN